MLIHTTPIDAGRTLAMDLFHNGHAHLTLEPGNATRYTMVAVWTPKDACLLFGLVGGHLVRLPDPSAPGTTEYHPSYLADKLHVGDADAEVVAATLNTMVEVWV